MPVGHSLMSETKSISYCIVQDPSPTSQRFIFVDTPGFDDYESEDREVLDDIVKWLKDSGRITLKLHIIYLVEITQPRQPEDRMGPSLLMNTIYPSLTVVTTKWGDTSTEIEMGREAEYSAVYPRTPHRFDNSRASAWDIVRLQPEPPVVQLLEFGILLDSVLPRTIPKPKRRIFAAFAGLFGFKKPSSIEHPHNRTKIVEGLCARLALVFQDTLKRKLLLSCQGTEAQALLDTFQAILDTGQSDANVRLNLIIAIRKLSTKTDLYPTPFYLKKLDRVSEKPEAGGAYGDIHRGVYLGRDVCLKSIKVYATTRPERIVKVRLPLGLCDYFDNPPYQMIAREAVLWGQLTHHSLLPFYGLYLYNDQLSLISPWASNGTISDFLSKQPMANRILLANILVDGCHRAYIADFGLSAVEDPEVMAWTRNSTASRGGTVRWQAPELFKVETDQESESEIPRNTKATDVYAFSCVCYEIFSGNIPFKNSSDAQVMLKVMGGERPALPLHLTDEFRVVIQGCWHGDPKKRSSITQVRSLLAPLIPKDPRRPGEWQGKLALREENKVDISLAFKRLDKILRRTFKV
ncbi:hypothetical protein DXG01_002907 [Tephrocybe rancida]|nr:hypothetical protein DXG01_002907 [Tephrocybe rancida]